MFPSPAGRVESRPLAEAHDGEVREPRPRLGAVGAERLQTRVQASRERARLVTEVA